MYDFHSIKDMMDMTKWYLSSLWCSQYLLSMMSTDSWTPWPWPHTQWSCNLIFLFIDKVLTKLPYPHPNPSYLTMWEEHSNPYLRSPFSCLFQVKGDLLRLSEIQEKTVSSHIFCYIKSDLNGIWTPLMLCIECLMQYSI